MYVCVWMYLVTTMSISFLAASWSFIVELRILLDGFLHRHWLAKCVHVIRTGCALSLSLSLALAHLYSLISSQVVIKSCTAAKTAQIPPSIPARWLVRPSQAYSPTGPLWSCDSAQSAFLLPFSANYSSGEARIGVSARRWSYRSGEMCAKEAKVASISGQIFAKQRLNGASCPRSEPGVTFQILGPRKIFAVSTKSRVFWVPGLKLRFAKSRPSCKYATWTILCSCLQSTSESRMNLSVWISNATYYI